MTTPLPDLIFTAEAQFHISESQFVNCETLSLPHEHRLVIYGHEVHQMEFHLSNLKLIISHVKIL